ncbi:MAG TPA: HEAT repeat domain-containing protein [Pyrinomonadaceae bacterium]|jgi:HEAT repeat protein
MLWWTLRDLQSKDPLKREAAVVKLASRGATAFDYIVRALSDSDAGVRQAAARALGEIGEDHAAMHLVGLFDDPVAYVREEAVRALGKIGGDHLVERLKPALKDGSGDVRDAAIQLVRRANTPDVSEVVREYEADERVRQEAESQRKAELERRKNELQREREILSLIDGLKFGSDETKKAARKALAHFGEPAVGPLSAALDDCVYKAEKHKGDNVLRNARFFISDTLADIGGPAAARALLRYVGEPFATHRIVRIGPAAVGPLIEALRSSPLIHRRSTKNRKGAAEALGAIKDARAVEPLIAALNDDPEVQWEAAKALGELGDKRAVEPLISLLKDRTVDWFRHAEVATALGQIGDARAIEPLIAALKHNEGQVRRQAAEALGKFADKGAVEPLISLLKDSYQDVCERAATALGKIGDEGAVEPLIAALEAASRKDEYNYINKGVRRAAAEALGEIGDKRAVEPLTSLLETESYEDVRESAEAALGKIRDGTSD